MTDQGRRLVEAAARLRQALEATAGALTSADLDALLKSDGEIELALRALAVPRSLAAEDRLTVRAELERIGRVLRRCRRLGTVLVDVVTLTLDAQGRTSGYERPGTVPATYGRHRFEATG